MPQLRRLSGFFLTALLVFLLGCAATQQYAGTGGTADNSDLGAKVRAAIFSDPDLKSDGIYVTAFNGIVHLSGSARSRADINKAVALARSVAGVAAVKNDVSLR